MSYNNSRKVLGSLGKEGGTPVYYLPKGADASFGPTGEATGGRRSSPESRLCTNCILPYVDVYGDDYTEAVCLY